MQHLRPTQTDRRPLDIQLAKPWHYRRAGVYYLRIRPIGKSATQTISLRTTDRPKAMAASKQIQTTLRKFHLDNPEATWDELRDHLKHIAEDVLATPTEWETMDSVGLVYSDIQEDLYRIAVTSALTHAQAQAVTLGQQIMVAAQHRVLGDPRQLVDIIGNLNQATGLDSNIRLSESLSVGHPNGSYAAPISSPTAHHEALTFEKLADLYMAEIAGHQSEGTAKETKSSCRAVAQAMGDLDLRRHTRADLVKVRERLQKDRKGSTVNKLLGRMSSVLTWAVNNGYLEKAYDKKLKLTKGADSSRKAFTQGQIVQLMGYANSLPMGSWERWTLSLCVITGARIGEVAALTREDVRQIGETWVVDINENNGKTLKNRYSARLIPLTDAAYGFSLECFLEFARERPKGESLWLRSYSQIAQTLRRIIQTVLCVQAGGDLSVHSLRHSLASILKAHEIPLSTAQAILGHSSQSITFDLYGGGQRVAIEKLADALARTLKQP